jgi:hypothetical protein
MAAARNPLQFHLHEPGPSPYVLAVPPRRLCVGAGALSPEKGGALRKQSTQGRRFGVAAVLCGGVFAAPLLLLQHGSPHGPRAVASSSRRVPQAVMGPSLYTVGLPSQLVRYQSAATTTTTTTAPVTTTPATVPASFESNRSESAPVEQTSAPATTTTTAPPVTPTPPPPPPVTDSERGQATWYAAAPAGRCASPTLPFGTVITVANDATGASVTCIVDDREQAGYPRVVDLSPSGFAQLADPSAGVVDVTISW